MSRTLPLTLWFLSTSFLGGVLLLCAGRSDVPMLKAYLVVFAGMGLATALAAEPALDGERRKPGPAEIDPGSRFAASLLFLATVIIAALDAGRFRWTPAVTVTTQIVALVALILSGAFQVWAMTANPFFSTAIRIQSERSHEIVTHGPYRFVRHPGYLAMAIFMPATALTLGSVFALIPALSYSALILHRTVREDRFLNATLPGYTGYAGAVYYRLIPGLW
ncbi:MAG TPA: isoprenylcysteine carboxylmethyltransferase family protein [Terriglobia bacterium]|nr:isoprenylcysteine carboxylmethyltransferase family protein [Terriglobia bacterium]